MRPEVSAEDRATLVEQHSSLRGRLRRSAEDRAALVAWYGAEQADRVIASIQSCGRDAEMHIRELGEPTFQELKPQKNAAREAALRIAKGVSR